MPDTIIKTVSDYKNLLSYQKADVVFQMTYYFCRNFLDRKDRTVDQMIQAARSGKQNIIEGCAASATSTKTELKLLNVAKASLKELLEDFEDFLKVNNFPIWQKGDIKFETMRKLGSLHNDAAFFMNLIQTRPPETIANMVIILINQADYLLFRQIKSVEENFIKSGGFSERMTQIRKQSRGY